jgi:hypothetical protein
MKARDDERQPTTHDWIAIFGAILGAFMAVLDIQITNASLKYIPRAKAASQRRCRRIAAGWRALIRADGYRKFR